MTVMNSTESTTDFTTTENENEITVDEDVETETPPEEDDNFGYDTPPETKKDETPPEEKKGDEESKDKTLTGYGDDENEEVPPASEEKKDDKPFDPATATEEEKAAHELEEVVKELPEALDKEKISKFAKDNKLNKDQLKAYGELVKEEQAADEAARKNAKATQKAAWKKELQEDKEFGGKNFDLNVKQVGKVLENNLPNMKKMLTEKGGVLPPYIMKDLLVLSKALYPKTPLVHGDASENADSKNFLDELY